jgi:hypothetical protein
MGDLWEPSQSNSFRRYGNRDLCRPILCGRSSVPPGECHVDIGQVCGVKSELASKVTEDDIERELMLSPTASLLLSPDRDQDRRSGTSVMYRE